MNIARPWIRRLRRLAYVIVALVCVDLVLRTEWVERPAARLLEAGIELATGERAVVGGVDFKPATGTIEVQGLVLSHVMESGETSPIVAVESVGLRLGLPIDGAIVRRLDIERPVISLNVDDDGLREFRKMSPSGGGSDELPWRWLGVNNARIEISSAAGSILLAGINLVSTEKDEVDISVDTARVRVAELDEVARQVRLDGVRFSPAGLVIEDMRIESQHTHAQGSLSAEFGGQLAGQVSVSVALPILDAFVSDVRSFEGSGHADLELAGTVREPVVKGTVLISDLVHHNVKNPEKPQRMDLERLLAQLRIEGRHLTIEDADIKWAEGRLDLKGSIDLVSRGIAAEVGLEGISLRSAIREAGGHRNSWAEFIGDGEAHLGGTLSPFRLVGTFSLATVDLDVGSGPPGGPKTNPVLQIPSVNLFGELDTNSDGIWLRSRDVRAGATSGAIDAFIGYGSSGPLDITYDLDRASLSTFRPVKNLDLFGFGSVKGTVKGPFKEVKFTASGNVRDFSMIGLPLADEAKVRFICDDLRTLEFHQFSGRLGSSPFYGRADVHISENTTMDVRVTFDDARVGDLVGIAGHHLPWLDGRLSGDLTMIGDPTAPNGEIDAEIRDAVLMGETFPSGHFKGWLDSGNIMIDELGLDRWSGEESLMARGSVTPDWDANIEVTGTGFRLERLNQLSEVALPMSADISIDAVVSGQLMDPRPVGRVALRNMVFADRSVPNSTVKFSPISDGIGFSGDLVQGGLRFEGSVPTTRDSFTVRATLDEFPVHTLFPGGVNGSPVKAFLDGDVTIDGDMSGPVPQAGLVGRGKSFGLEWDRHKLQTLGPWDFALTGREMQLSGFRIQGAGTDINWALSSDEAGELTGGGGGFIDADLARMLVPGLTRSDGTIALNLGVDGTIQDPKWSVDLAILDATMQGNWFPHPVEGIEGVVSVTENETLFRSLDPDDRDAKWVADNATLAQSARRLKRFDGLRGTIGGGAARVQGGWRSQGWSPMEFGMTGTVTNGRVQYLEDFPAAVGNANLTFDGPVGELLLAGRIDVSEMVFNERITWEDNLFQPSADGAAVIALDEEEPWFDMDIDMVADDTVRVRNNLADMVAGGSLKLIGDTKQPGLVGHIRCEPGGSVYLKERDFEVQRAELHFVDPFTYDPEVDLLLQTDIRARNEDYNIHYQVSGTYNDWQAETRSEPALPQADVNALLLFGMTRAELERYGGLGGAIAMEGGDLLASSVLFNGLDDPDRGGLFRIVDPLRPERLDLVSGVSERGSGIVTSELRLLYENELADVGLPGTMMIFEQNISRSTDTYLGIEQRLARKLYARTYWGSEQVGRYTDLGGAYGFDVKVRWELD